MVARAFWLAILTGPAAAQGMSPFGPNVDTGFQTAFSHPASLDAVLTYGAGVTQTADVESSISTFERLLFYNPKLSRLRFELCVLYYRLGSYEQARGYFQSALEMADITPDLRERTEEFLIAIERKLLPDQFAGFVQTGARYQTNASLGPGPQGILASGQTFNSSFFARPDWNWFAAFGVNYTHDFGTQTGDAFEASLIGSDAQQFTLHQFDLGLAELRAGPRFAIFPDIVNGASIKPYVVATGSTLADTVFNGGVGGGLTIHAPVGTIAALDPYVEVVEQGYRNSTFYPLAGGLSGTLATYAMQGSGPILSGLNWQARLAYAHDYAVFTPYAYDAFSADLWLPWHFALPWDRHVWTLTPSAGVVDWIYSAPDPTINPTVAQRSIEYRFGLGLDVPIADQFSLGALVQYIMISSNLPVFSMHDLAVSVGPTLKF